MRVRGIDKIKQQLQQHRDQTAASIRRGLWKVGLYIQRESMMRTPVDTGNLRASANTRIKQTARGASVRVVYTAAYAIFVHENLYSRHTVGEAKFLVKAVTQNLARIVLIFKNEFK